eukprot:1400288-Lingulodinium_polyedra.AAC.1
MLNSNCKYGNDFRNPTEALLGTNIVKTRIQNLSTINFAACCYFRNLKFHLLVILWSCRNVTNLA